MKQNQTADRRIEQFDTKHGDDGIVLDGWLIFSDGAKREPHNSLGTLVEPPNDKQALEKVKLAYQEEVLRRATENLQQRKQAIVQHTLPKTPAQLHLEFDAKHRKDGPGLLDGSFYIYPDGAYRDTSTLGVLAEPRNDRWNPLAVENRIIRYWELALAQAADNFNEQRDAWLRAAKTNQAAQFAQAPPETTRRAVRELKKLKEAVVFAQSKLDEARQALEGNKPEDQRVREETSRVHSAANSEFITKVENIQI